MDFYTNLTLKVQKGRGLGSRDPISIFWDPPNNFWTNRAIRFKFGADIEDGPVRRVDHKTTRKWTWPESRDQILKFWDPPYNFGTNRAIRFKFGIDIDDGLLLRPDYKTTPKWAWPGSRDRISKFWDPPYNFWTNGDICFKLGTDTDIDDGPLLLPDHKTTPKWAWPGSRDQISKLWNAL